MTNEQRVFIEKIGPMAAQDMKKTGILASLTIAQAILESGWGKSGLTVKANNLFGIKGSYNGASLSCQTQEWDGAKYITITAAFRKYPSWAESVADHSGLFLRLDRYKNLRGCTDYKKACQFVREDGYATAPDYSEKLVKIIETYGLTVYDGAGNNGGQKMTEAQARARAVSIAQGFEGCKASDGSHKKIIDLYNACKPLARGYPMQYTDAWCACFVSVVGIQAGYTDIMPRECGCGQMIELYRKLGRWEENDAYRPNPGDVIFYDWEDSGTGDNAGAPNHVGIVVSVTGSTIRVIEGNKNNAVGYRDIAVNGKFVRGFGLPDYAKKATGTAQPPAEQPQAPNGSNDTGGTLALSTGDMVRFAGNTHYSSANAASGTTCKPGAAKVTQVAKGAKHPYHLVKESGGGSTVYGWVNAADVSKATGGDTTPTMRAGAKVRYSGRLYANSDGGGAGKAVNGTYTVSRVIAGKKCGVLLNGGLGWVPESACVVIG